MLGLIPFVLPQYASIKAWVRTIGDQVVSRVEIADGVEGRFPGGVPKNTSVQEIQPQQLLSAEQAVLSPFVGVRDWLQRSVKMSSIEALAAAQLGNIPLPILTIGPHSQRNMSQMQVSMRLDSDFLQYTDGNQRESQT